MNDIFEFNTSSRQAAVSGLAVVGFIALVATGIWLALYSTRFVPDVVGRIGTAAVYLGSIFTPGDATLSVVSTPTASTSIQTNPASAITSTSTASAIPSPILPKTIATIPGEQTTGTYQISEATTSVQNGLPDLVVNITATGYLATTSAESFIASSTVPVGSRPAVTFIIKNVGSSQSGPWRFSASIPTQSVFIFQSQPQQSLNPGDSIDYTLGFDQAIKGADKTISITANFDQTVAESSTDNNNASTKITILGS